MSRSILLLFIVPESIVWSSYVLYSNFIHYETGLCLYFALNFLTNYVCATLYAPVSETLDSINIVVPKET